MAVTTELVLARHGEANNNATGTVGGERGCTGLSPQGREQAQRLALRLAHEHAEQPFDAFYGTPRRRVRDTAEIIGQALSLAVTVVDALRCAAPTTATPMAAPGSRSIPRSGDHLNTTQTGPTPPAPKPGTRTAALS